RLPLLAQERGNRRLAAGPSCVDFRRARPQLFVVRFDGEGKASIGLGVLMRAIDPGLSWQPPQLLQGIPHLRGRPLEKTSAAEGEERIPAEEIGRASGRERGRMPGAACGGK